MKGAHEQFTEEFRLWEKAGRGWTVWPHPVSPEPPFRPFRRKHLHETPAVDDGHRPTFLSSFVQKLSRKLSDRPPPPPASEPEKEPEPPEMTRETQVELQTSLPAKLDIGSEAFLQFLRNISLCRAPVAFELLGVPGRVGVQFAADEDDARAVRRHLKAFFPEAEFHETRGVLESVWEASDGEEVLVVEFGLSREFMYSLQIGKLDPFVGLVGALSELKPREVGLFQVLFEPVKEKWAESIVKSVSDAEGKPFFVNMPELTAAAEEKVRQPLYAAVVRIAVKSESYEGAVAIARDLAGSLGVFANPGGNELIPLSNEGYPDEDHVEDVLCRQSRRSGMILGSDELIGFVHLPSSDVATPALTRDSGKTKAPPEIARNATGLLLGYNTHLGTTIPVRLPAQLRVRHMHVIGGSGTGKSTLLFNLIWQGIQNGEGVAVLDPHGDLVNAILGVIPPHRVNDVVLLDPSDEEYSIGFNILSAHSDLEKTLLSSDLVSIFQRLSTSWGDQMGIVLQNAILAFLESSVGGTLADLRRFLIEPAFREKFLATVGDPDIVSYWRKDFAQLSGNRSIGPVLTRLQEFLAPKPIRYMVSQKENRLDFKNILDTGKIFLAKLPQGQIGAKNAFLLGSLLVAKFQQLVMGRQAQQVASRKDFWLYIDEFQDFITPSMAAILRGARKYRLGLILAHQELRHLERDRDVASAVLTNCGTRVVFHVSDEDAKKLGEGFASFESRDLQNLETGHAICRIERADGDFNLSVPLSEAPDPELAEATRQAVIKASRAKYATPRAEVERARAASFDAAEAEPKEKTPAPHPPQPKASPNKPSAPATPERKETLETKPHEAATTPNQGPPATDADEDDPEHKKISKLVVSEAEASDYTVTTEWKVPGTQKKIDIVLERGKLRIACEINSTNTLDYEVGNLVKCFDAGFERVVMVCGNPRKLSHISERYQQSGATGTVLFHAPDEFIVKLRDWAREDPAGAAVERGKPQKRRTPFGSGARTESERKATHEELLETLRRALKR